MPSPAEQPHGSRPWWREPLPAEERQPAAPDQPGAPADASTPEPPTPEPHSPEPPHRAPYGAEPPHRAPYSPELSRGPYSPEPPHPEPHSPEPHSPEPSSPVASWVVPVAGPADATVLMHPISDATRELPPVPAEPDRFVPVPAAVASPPMTAGAPGAFGGAPPAVRPGPEGIAGPTDPAEPTGLPGPVDGAGDGLPGTAPTRPGAGLRDLLARLTGADGERRGRLVTVGGVALAIVLVLAGAGLLVSRLHDDRTASGGGAPAAAVDLTTVRGSASSVQRPDGGISYDVANTLDGNPNTAWNSDGAKDGRGPGIALTYQFAGPVDLRSITIRNGYQKVRAKDGVDLWPLNERVRQLEVITDTGTWTWPLSDTKDPQTLQQHFGRTRTVRLKIVQIYPSQKYKDVAISEIAFMAAS